MFELFLKYDDVLNRRPFTDQEAQYDIIYNVTSGELAVALTSCDRRTIAVQTPGHFMVLWIDPALEAEEVNIRISALCGILKENRLPGVMAEPSIAQAFADAYASIHGITYILVSPLLVYTCPKCKPPYDVSGSVFLADMKYQAIVAEFCAGFDADIFGRLETTPESQLNKAERMIRSGRLYLWRDGNDIISMARISHRSPRYARIGSVYTLPEFRGKGYAGALVAEMCELVGQEGLIPMLYTNVENQISNHVYRKIGFVEHGRLDNIGFQYEENR